SVFPNPAKNSLTIKNYSNSLNKYQLSIKNLEGQEILTRSIEFVDNFEIDITTLSNGLYFLILQNETEQIQQKLIVQH
ncbi:MAG: T9SS type A sorting domain-containing protein, partial [Bacteroidetes bacterium]|nr:T9SS type A sorting domain-containing protein [Bacteroidota bacterium]